MLQWVARKFRDQLHITTVWRIILLTVVLCSLFSGVVIVHAQTASVTTNTVLEGTNVIAPAIGLPNSDIRVIIGRIIKAALALVGIVFLCLVLYGGFVWMTAGGNEEKIASAKRIIFNGAIGIGIILSAYSLVLFVLKLFGLNGSSAPNGGGAGVTVAEQNFFGSGSLGSIIRDHYPARNQVDVPRNTKIIVSFRRPVNLASFINDRNGNGTLGDCINIGPSMNWESDCDQLKITPDTFNILRTDTNEVIRGASALVSLESGKAYTVVIRPYDPLGTDTNKITYTVHVGKSVLLDDPANSNPSIFQGRGSGRDFYEWLFTCDTALDKLPPHVTSVFPAAGSTETKNSILQINFNKAMDPSDLQGEFSAGSGTFVLRGNAVYVKSGNSTMPAGTFSLVNNYQTMEFTPSTECGQNACGGTVFCMPVCDTAGASCSSDGYQVLLRAAQTYSTSSFEAIPFSGVADVSGNALDGNNNGVVDIAPKTGAIFPNQNKPDNFSWAFDLNSSLDISAPFLTKVQPGPDATFVAPNDEWSMVFSKRMRALSLYNIAIDETPTSSEPLCEVPAANYNSDGSSYVRINHCPFLSGDRHYYFPIIDSSVEDVHFNCFYPGKGPLGLQGSTNVSTVCDSNNPGNCCPVDAATPFCCNGITNSADRATCLANLKASSP